MTINAVQHFVKNACDKLASPYYGGVLTAYIRPFVPGNVRMKTPELYVWGSTGDESRVSIPRGVALPTYEPGEIDSPTSGWKQAKYLLRVWLIGTDKNNDPHGDEKFPILQETVKKVLRAQVVPAKLVDPTTADVSFLMDLGETVSWEYDVDRTSGDQRLLRSAAVLSCSVTELFQS